MKIRYGFVLLLLLLTGCQHEPSVTLNGKNVLVEIANNDQERSVGLMYREHLDENKGMLFTYPDENIRSFWMKNTLIPLDMIFINKNFEIVDIHQAEPCPKEGECPSYGAKAQYILEVNKGFSQKNNISVGNKIKI